jgi:hypothetical protein
MRTGQSALGKSAVRILLFLLSINAQIQGGVAAFPRAIFSVGTMLEFAVPFGGRMADVRVTCITKPNPLSTHEHITHIGGPRLEMGSRYGDPKH